MMSQAAVICSLKRQPDPLKNEVLKIGQLLDTFLYEDKISEANAYIALEKYSNENFYAYTRYAILQKNAKESQYILYLYQKPNRKEPQGLATTLSLNITQQNKIMTNQDEYLHGLILLKKKNSEVKPLDFYKSIKTKTEVFVIAKNPYPHDHFIYLSFLDGAMWNDLPEIFKENITLIKKKFKQTDAFTFDLYKFHDPNQYEKEIKNLSSLTKQKTGKICIILDGHCNSGNNFISGEYNDPNGMEKKTTWHMTKLVKLIKRLSLSHDAKIDIDVYACHAGKGLSSKPAFICYLKKALNKQGLNNLSITGNFHVVFAPTKVNAHPTLVFAQSPEDVATVGRLREPMTSIEKFKNSETMIYIKELLGTPNDTSSRGQAISALKQYADNIYQQTEDSLQFDTSYAILQTSLANFEKLDQLAKRTKIFISAKKTTSSIEQKAMAIVLQRVNRCYLESAKTLSFIKAYAELSLALTLLDPYKLEEEATKEINKIKPILVSMRSKMHLWDKDRNHIDKQLKEIRLAEHRLISYKSVLENAEKVTRESQRLMSHKRISTR